jgi:Carbohydrate-selective porin, OprB family/S-layer homology domain
MEMKNCWWMSAMWVVVAPGVGMGQPLFSTDQPTPIAEPTALAQVTRVDQLSDVQPTDWSYQALRSLVETYGVIAGLPNGTFEGDRPLTRYEFAAALSAAMDALQTQPTDSVSTADLATLQRLTESYAAELATLKGRVDSLEARTAEIEANQFSTTVVLSGESTFAVANSWGGDRPGDGTSNPVFTHLTQLQLSGSFTGNDAFRVGLDASNFAGQGFAEPEVLNTKMALLSYQSDSQNQVNVSSLDYRAAVGDRLVVTLKPVGFSLSSVLTPNSLFPSASQGALSRFAGEPTVFKIGSLDAGVGLDWLISNRARLQVAYGVGDAGDNEQGLFSSDHRALGVQLLARPFNNVTTGIAYVNAFSDNGFLDTFTGSSNADTSGGFEERSTIHAVSGTLRWQVTPQVAIGATGGVTLTDSLPSDAAALSTTYMFSLGYADPLGREGDLLGVMVGQPLRLRYGLNIPSEDEGSAMHYELFYRFRVSDNIAITPGFFMVTDPGHIEENNTIYVGAVRTSFAF